MTLEELCVSYGIQAKLGLFVNLGSRPLIGLEGFNGKLCKTAFTEMDWNGEPIEAWRVILVCFTELLSYWSKKPGEKYLPFTSQHKIELNEVRRLNYEIRYFLGDSLEEFVTAAWPYLYVPRYLRESLRASVQCKDGQGVVSRGPRNAWRYRPKLEIKGHPEVCLSTFGEEEETGD